MKRLSFKNLHTLQSINLFFIFCLGATLVFKDIYSTIIVLVLLLFAIPSLRFPERFRFSKKEKTFLAFASLLILPRIISFFTGNVDAAMNELIRALPIIIVPFIFLVNRLGNQTETFFYFGLLTGLILFISICEYNVITKMIEKNEPLEFFFRWRHLNINFVQPIGTHPPYVGILTIWMLVKTLYNNILNKKLKGLLIFILAIFLFQLLARNAIIVAIILVFFYSIKNLKLKQIGVIFMLMIGMMLVVVYHPHPYLREKIFYKLNPFDNKMKDKRVSRLNASIEVFKRSPLLGVGPKNDDKLRKIEYIKMNDLVAYENNYNSHNQFFEYLTSNGLAGFLCFIMLIFFLIKTTYLNKDYVNLTLLFCFIVACLSESILERSLGIKYFSILMAFIFLNYTISKKNINQKSKTIRT